MPTWSYSVGHRRSTMQERRRMRRQRRRAHRAGRPDWPMPMPPPYPADDEGRPTPDA